jgi:hypothetical protein
MGDYWSLKGDEELAKYYWEKASLYADKLKEL